MNCEYLCGRRCENAHVRAEIRNINNPRDIYQTKQSPIVDIVFLIAFAGLRIFINNRRLFREVDFHISGRETRVFPPKLTFDVIVSYVSLRASRVALKRNVRSCFASLRPPIVCRATRWKNWRATVYLSGLITKSSPSTFSKVLSRTCNKKELHTCIKPQAPEKRNFVRNLIFYFAFAKARQGLLAVVM